jgi:hypothetical protein
MIAPMKSRLPILLSAAVAVLAGAGARAPAQVVRLQSVIQRAPDSGSPAEPVSGTVVDSAGQPIAGATVEYWQYEGNLFRPKAQEVKKQITTGADGSFEIQVSRGIGFLLARKAGLAAAWRQVGRPFNAGTEAAMKLVLTPPGTLAGTLLDESNQPAANAAVFVAAAFSEVTFENGGTSLGYLIGKPARDNFAARTDAAGHFRIENFPTNGGAIFSVELPGKVLRPPAAMQDWQSAGFHVGDDIKLVLEAAGSVEGKIVCEEAGQALPTARVSLLSDAPGVFGSLEVEPVETAADGTFRCSTVMAGSYHLQAVIGTNAPADWVAERVAVSVEAGQAARDVRLTAARGGLLEVALLGEDNHQPQPQVSVSAFNQHYQSAAESDSNGVARLRLPPGEYQLSALRQYLAASQTSASVEAGKTNRVEIEIAAPRKITGVVRGPDGQPAAGVSVRLITGFGSQADAKSDAEGKFDVEWNPRRFGGQNDATFCVLARDAERNLAAAQDIDEDTGPVELKLAPGLTLAGRAEADGQPVTNATAQLVFWTGRSGMWMQGWARTNAPGKFEIPALPPGRKYGIVVSAPGYGNHQMNNLEVSADPGRQELEPAELKPANLKLAGQVVDAEDKPVAGCNVNLNGEDQPNGHVRTDREGRFAFPHVCEGQVRLFANGEGAFGNISAEGGDTNIVLRLGQNAGVSSGVQTHKLKGVVADADGKPVAGAQLTVFPNNGGSRVKTGSDGTYSLTWSLQPWQAQSGAGALLIARAAARNLAASQELPEEATNLDVKLKAALTVTGVVKGPDDSPLGNAQVTVMIRVGNMSEQLNDQPALADASGRFEVKCLPPDAQCTIIATALGYGRHTQAVLPDAETNRLELAPFVLKPANRVVAGQVLNGEDKPVAGVNVNLNGEEQPDGYMVTDSKGAFHFKVCEGPLNLFASSQSGGFAQASAEGGDTNVVITLRANAGGAPETSRRASLKGSPLPDLAGVNLAAEAAPAGQPVLLCLFDAGQRPSRHVIHQLNDQAAALRQKNVCVVGIQAAVTTDEVFNDWKTASPVSFPVGRVMEKSDKCKWASSVNTLPWLILTDASHRIVADGFALDELDAQIGKLAK